MTQEEIRSLFSNVGEVESCKLIRDKQTGERRQLLLYSVMMSVQVMHRGKYILGCSFVHLCDIVVIQQTTRVVIFS